MCEGGPPELICGRLPVSMMGIKVLWGHWEASSGHRESRVGQSIDSRAVVRAGMVRGRASSGFWVLCPVSVFPACVWFQWRIAGCGAPCPAPHGFCPWLSSHTYLYSIEHFWCCAVFNCKRKCVNVCLKSFHFFSSPSSGNSGLTSSVVMFGCGSGRVGSACASAELRCQGPAAPWAVSCQQSSPKGGLASPCTHQASLLSLCQVSLGEKAAVCM